MRFRVLGPLEVVDGERVVGLGGTRQRATLGFLLLHLNQVVATSALLGALWPDEPPASARKILQNAIWGLRSALSSPDGGAESATLVTQTPGYMLNAEPALLDLHEFHRLAERGRALLAAGDFEEASRALCLALELWRGPALVDLVEAGLAWRELSALQNLRLDVLEDYFEAELSCGRHTVLGELERIVESNPLRERSCGQLMLALYRCGRQADALTVFSRVRSKLVEELGLEPRRELQVLQHAILTHDQTLMSLPPVLGRVIPAQPDRGRTLPVLEPVGPGGRAVPAPLPVGRPFAPGPAARPDGPAAGRMPGPAPDAGTPDLAPAARAPEASPGRAVEPIATLAGPPPDRSGPVPDAVAGPGSGVGPAGEPAAGVPGSAQRKQVSVLMVHTAVDLHQDADRLDVLDGVADTVRESVEYFHGVVTASIGSVTMALFDLPRELDNTVERAVWAALAVKDCLAARLRAVTGAQAVVRAAVTTGEAVVRYQVTGAGASLSVTGPPVEECQAVLDAVPAGDTWISEPARREAERSVVCHQVADRPRLWRVDNVRSEWAPYEGVPVVDREHELELLRGLMDRTRHRGTPHLVTVLGGAGVGKTRFLQEFRRRVAAHPTGTQLVVAPAGPEEDRLAGVLAGTVAACCGLAPGDTPATVRDKLAAAAARHLPPDRAGVVTGRLLDLAAPAGPAVTGEPAGELAAAWRELVGAVARDRGMVVVVDDLHRAGDRLLAFVHELTGALGPVPLLVLVAARAELIERRPDWGGGLRQATTITLDPLSDEAIDGLLDLLLAGRGPAGDEPAEDGPDPVGGEVLDARREHVRMLLCLDRRMLGESA